MGIKNKKTNKIAILCGVLAISVGVYFLLNNNSNNNQASTTLDSPGTTSTLPTAQDDFTGGSDREVLEREQSQSSAIISDTSGSGVDQQDTSNPMVSATGEITVFSPSKEQEISSGVTLAGTSTLPIINFRIIDDVSGVISEGSLKVVDGKFSGTLTYNTSATEGRIDIYASRDDGSEYSNVEIQVIF